MSSDEADDEATITRGGQPLEQGPPAETMRAAGQAHEREISADREQIGTTRGGQPIEDVKDD